MSAYSEAELKYARPLAFALIDSTSFRRWWFTGTRFENVSARLVPVGAQQAFGRTKGTKAPFWFNYWCGRDRHCTCRIGTGIETDVLLMFSSPESRIIALHIEVKRPNEKLGDGQAESYSRRAACWADRKTKPKTVMAHDDFIVSIACGRNLAGDHRLNLFEKVVFHDEIAAMTDGYPESDMVPE